MAFDGRAQWRLTDKLHAVFEAEPLEDGMHHSAEQVVAATLGSHDERDVLRRLRAICLESNRPAFAASVFLCIARQPDIGTPQWRRELVSGGLAVDEVEVRDAAAQVAELWGGQGLRDVLNAHREPVKWLRDYIRDVVDDLAR